MIRGSIFGVAVAIAVALASAGSAGESLVLAHGGQTAYVIALAEDASAAERNAAAELTAYLTASTGARFRLVAPGGAAGTPVIAVGPGAAKAVVPGLDLARTGAAGLGDDGIVVLSSGANLVLTGAEGSKRGALYAVYEFLERVVGVRWWTPTEESVPVHETLSMTPLDIRYVPPILYRETLCTATGPAHFSPAVDVPMFAIRMRQNGHFPKIPAAWGGHYTIIGWCHTFYRPGFALISPERYFGEHPEWFSEINGRRTHERAQLCMTNDAMLEEMARNVLDHIRRNPDAGMISVAQNDHRGNCQCARCRALDEAEGSPAGSLLYGINRVAEIVAREFPDVFLVTLAYQYTRKPPKTIRPHDNVVIRYCVIERSAVHPIEHLMNRELLEDLTGWSRMAPKLAIWDYTANLRSPFTPEPRTLVYGPDMRLYRRCNVNSVFCEHSHGASPLSDFEPLHTWLLSKLMWNPDQDDRALIREFLDGYFGSAGRSIGAYLHLLSGAAAEARVKSWSHGHDAEWLDLITMNRATELFDEAEAAVAGDAVRLQRVRRARLSLDHQWLVGYVRYRAAQMRGARMLGPADVETAITAFIARARAAGVAQFGYGGSGRTTIEEHGDALRERNVLARSERYLASLAGEPVPLPDAFADTARDRVVDLQENGMSLFPGAVLVPDEAASNGAAAKMDASVRSWAVQIRDLPAKGIEGRFHAYALVRCDALAPGGIAFTGGVYDTVSRRNLIGVTGRIESQAPNEVRGEDIDTNPDVPTAAIAASPTGMGDGAYHLVDFGTHSFRDGMHVWFGTTGGVDRGNVKAIHIDRVIFVREP